MNVKGLVMVFPDSALVYFDVIDKPDTVNNNKRHSRQKISGN